MHRHIVTLYSVPYTLAPENYMSTLFLMFCDNIVGRVSKCMRYGWGLRLCNDISQLYAVRSGEGI